MSNQQCSGGDEMADGSHVNGGSTPGRDRYAAVVAALLDVRTDDATARFDDEVAKAVANHRLDAQTARTLRWWQRTSVQAAENYAASVLSTLLEAREQAERAARHDVEGAAAAWETARAVTNARQPAGAPAPDAPGPELAAVRLLTPRPRSAESTQAVRTALAHASDVDLIATTISTPNSASSKGKDQPGHANPATSA